MERKVTRDKEYVGLGVGVDREGSVGGRAAEEEVRRTGRWRCGPGPASFRSMLCENEAHLYPTSHLQY